MADIEWAAASCSAAQLRSWASAMLKAAEAGGEVDGLDELYEAVAEAHATPETKWICKSFLPSDRAASEITDPVRKSQHGQRWLDRWCIVLNLSCLAVQSEWVRIRESKVIIGQGTTGLSTWAAALALAEWGCRNQAEIQGKCVLELGCGPRLAGLAVAHCCDPSHVILSDVDEQVLQLARDNVQCNRLTNATVNSLDWGSWQAADLEAISPEVIIAADVVYDPELVTLLIRLLAALLDRGDATARPVALVACTERNPETYALFTTALSDTGIVSTTLEVPTARWFPRPAADNVHLLKLHMEGT